MKSDKYLERILLLRIRPYYLLVGILIIICVQVYVLSRKSSMKVNYAAPKSEQVAPKSAIEAVKEKAPFVLSGEWGSYIKYSRLARIISGPAEDIYVLDEHSGVIRFNKDGVLIHRIGQHQLYAYATPGIFDVPKDIAVDSYSNLYVIGDRHGTVQKFDKDGKFVHLWTEFPDEKGVRGLSNIHAKAIAVDNDNYVYVTMEDALILKFDGDGKLLSKWDLIEKNLFEKKGRVRYKLGRMTVDRSNNLYVSDGYKGRVLKFSPSGELLLQIGKPGKGNGQLYYPHDLYVDSDYILYVLDAGNCRIQAFSFFGDWLFSWSWQGMRNLDCKSEYPVSFTIGDSGKAYLSTYGNIFEFQRSGLGFAR